MKIKQDFVTNSSSTSYIAYIPDNFDITKFKDIIKEKYSDDIEEERIIKNWEDEIITNDSVDEFIDKIFEEFNDLIKTGTSYQCDNPCFWIISNFISELELVIDTENAGSEDGTITNINCSRMKEKISTIKTGGWGIKYGGWGHESKD